MGELIITVKAANDEAAGFVKPNPAENITADADGTLHVGGRLGAFEGTTGIFHPNDRAPRDVAGFTFLITDSIGMKASAPRSFVLATGVGLTLSKSHEAGSTAYTVKNTYANRLLCAGVKYLSLDESAATQSRIAEVLSCTIDGQDFTPDSSADSSTPIVITVAESVNPDAATSKLRAFSGIMGGFCSEYIGQCVGGDTGGASLVIGQQCFNKSGNACALVGAHIWNSGNGNAVFGRQHISRKNRSLLAGTGHDTTNGPSESVAALGQWSEIRNATLLAVGNGTSHTNRKNAFEITNDGGMVLTDPEGGRWKFTVNTSGVLSGTRLA